MKGPIMFEQFTGEVLANEAAENNLTKKHESDAGLDICSAEDVTIRPQSQALISTGLFIAVPTGCVGLIWSRSGLAAKHGIEAGAGCIDAAYRGELKVLLHNHGQADYQVKKGDKIAQLLTVPVVLASYKKVDRLSDTPRGEGGFGSTGR